ncbi:hypothetical protein [Aeoliella mucimassa]|nr:hypothetical protein [Aeoliella mucimassa]
MVLIVVPGEDINASYFSIRSIEKPERVALRFKAEQTVWERYPDLSRSTTDVYTTSYQHGWPWPYLERSRAFLIDFSQPDVVPEFKFGGDDYTPYYVSRPLPSTPWIWFYPETDLIPPVTHRCITWSNFDHWPLRSDSQQWYRVNLVLDSSILLGVTLVTLVGTEQWIRWRGGLLKFRLVELLGVLLLCSVALGWQQYHARLAQFEEGLTNELYASVGELNRELMAPLWLQKLVGYEPLLPDFLRHVTECRYLGHTTHGQAEELWQSDFKQLAKLDYLEELTLSLDAENTAKKKLPDFSKAVLPAEPLLKVQKLAIDGTHFKHADLEALLNVVAVEKLFLTNHRLTSAEVQQLMDRHPNIQVCTTGSTERRDPNDSPSPSFSSDPINEIEDNPLIQVQ